MENFSFLYKSFCVNNQFYLLFYLLIKIS
jgi:hypothetical protein